MKRPRGKNIHTWPEDGLLTLDCFTCGTMDPEVILARVRAHFRPVREQVTAVERGNRYHHDGAR